MATGVLPAPVSGIKIPDSKVGFGKSMNLVRICDVRSLRSARRRVSVIRNSNQGSDLAELQPASEGSPLLGILHKRFIQIYHFIAFSELLIGCYIDFCSAKTEIL